MERRRKGRIVSQTVSVCVSRMPLLLLAGNTISLAQSGFFVDDDFPFWLAVRVF